MIPLKALYDICTDATEIIAGTSNRYDESYTEAFGITMGRNPVKSLSYLKSFAASIEKVMAKKDIGMMEVKLSRGNIEKVNRYKVTVDAIGYLERHLPGNEDLRCINSIIDSLKSMSPQYAEGYKRKIKLITLEYESAVLAVTRGVTTLIAENIDPTIDSTDGSISIQRKDSVSGGVVSKLVREMAAELDKDTHLGYLDQVLKIDIESKERDPNDNIDIKVESTFTEAEAESLFATVQDFFVYAKRGGRAALNIFNTVVKSIFGIIPLIRSVIHLYYNTKATMAENLDAQADFIELNIQVLKNKKGDMDPDKKATIIKKQEAYVQRYRNKAEKIRAVLIEGEKHTATAIKDSKIEPDNSGDDDLVFD